VRRRIFRTAAVFGLSVAMLANSPSSSAFASTKKSDSIPLSGFSYIYQQYLDSVSGDDTDAEATLLSTPISIPENAAIAKVDDYCNVREGAGTNYDIIALFTKNSYCVVKDVTDDGWAHIKSGSVDGYIKSDYLYMGDEGYDKACSLAHLVATVTAGSVNVRSNPDTSDDSNIVMEVSKGEELDVVEEAVLSKNDDEAKLWVKVELDSSDTESEKSYGYIAKDFVDVGYDWKTATKIDPIDASISSARINMVNEAKKHIGLRYVWGGNSLVSGCDCSGFCLAIYRACGISTSSIPRCSYELAASSMGKTVSLSNAKPGDLVFYGNSSGHVDHVALYIGNGQVIHESGWESGCKLSNVNYRSIIKIKNFIDYIQ
jgi:peptidoglycan DL-endopeptidase CwlO